ncbi:carbohydrate ABC transporter permease [Streptomyces sp. HPF1205]|uniref:carbohydrate ABC transporter permease n=1 Tax=Streptomyces sp. HPF1205 TaxID=2873262 RepID=UPI001CED01C6|nr:sugar ABC transporter permease [Streptomyces sp. HPF1205]
MTATAPPRRTPEAGPGRGTAAAGRRLRPRLVERVRKGGLPYLLLLPALLAESLIHIVPMVFGVVISFKNLTLFWIRRWSGAPWAGLGNYRAAVRFHQPIGQALLHSFWVTLAYSLLSVALSWLLGIAAAVLLQDDFRGRGVLRAVFLVPYALPAYAALITWVFMFQQDTGLVNHVLHDQLHVTSGKSFWLIGDNSFWAMVIVSVWKSWPFAFLSLMAGLQNIPRELYEAAAMDGAGVWQQLRRITLPALRPVNQVLVLVLFLWTFNDFNTPYVMFGQSPPRQADLISIHIYQSSFVTWNFGSGSAMSVLLLLFLLVVTAVYLLLTSMRRGDADA